MRRNQTWLSLVVAVIFVGLLWVLVRFLWSRLHCETVINRWGRMVEGSAKSSLLLMMVLRSVYLSRGQILKAIAQVGSFEKSWT